MTINLDELCKQLDITEKLPPVGLWQPELSGEIDILIDSKGDWYHEGDLIQRHQLVKLFSSILRFDEGLGYCLVTPVEKWLIRVEDVPFIIKRFDRLEDGRLALSTNVDDLVMLELPEQWSLRSFQGVLVPYVLVREHLWARVSRAVFYALAEEAKEEESAIGVYSGQQFYPLETD